ncbi:von Willebrand factor type A [Acidimicrobium ferrooxidans DSM 10331]|uniref:von Willebrand factor type A n=1 Tax=Acidimicrobium ferrooxidans (strain DSM 10331 / JCM 15462 / NBRC 103882 / ICP) TaxID=525909 RepID=C7M203_ACIFD|nr:VWA domain-containing protein [Acidimicrobium ferrooxidans]ACU53101.1 von Willebrand factor type A [Acidimicrobium ferrooxidans DSM 10331]
MAIELERYQGLLDSLGSQAEEVLRAAWDEATRSFSPRGLEEVYLRSAASLAALGRGSDLVVSFLQHAPALARELGEDAVRDLVAASVAFFSKTSASVIAELIATSPRAAERLGDLELFRSYLGLIDQLLGLAPRGVRGLLDHLDVLLAQLTLSGLTRWALWGAQVHKVDFEAQQRYFALESPDALAMLQQQRRGLLFVDVQRRLQAYLRALWGRDFFLRPESADPQTAAVVRPFIDGFVVHLPDAYDDTDGVGGPISALEQYRAAAAHAAAHQVATTHAVARAERSRLEELVVGILEDARVERAAIAAFPGLAALWARFHVVDLAADDPSSLVARLVRSLLVGCDTEAHPWVREACEHARVLDELGGAEAAAALPELARTLIDAARRFGVELDQVDSRAVLPSYRDDNRYVFERDEAIRAQAANLDLAPSQVRKYVSVMEMINEVDVPSAGDDAEEIWVLATEFFRDGEAESVNAQEGREPPPVEVHYPEWDYQVQLERPSWTTVLERRGPLGSLEEAEAILAKHRPLLGRMRRIMEALAPEGVQRLRKQEEGEELDINAAVDFAVDLRRAEEPDLRVMVRTRRIVRDLAFLLLIDTSESTNDQVLGADVTVIELAREATLLLAESINRVGDPFAVHGFDSNGRHAVEYVRYKDFDERFGDEARARVAGMTGQLSTRMGAAIRHAGAHLARQPQRRRLLLVLTDGEPADNDVRDPQYLRADARRAVEELARAGISTFCLSLDPRADQYVARIFGPTGFIVLDNVARLPERLPLLYAALTRS